MIKLYDGIIDQEVTLCHYINSSDVNSDTFDYIKSILMFPFNFEPKS